jgi:hypothetical protein
MHLLACLRELVAAANAQRLVHNLQEKREGVGQYQNDMLPEHVSATRRAWRTRTAKKLSRSVGFREAISLVVRSYALPGTLGPGTSPDGVRGLRSRLAGGIQL